MLRYRIMAGAVTAAAAAAAVTAVHFSAAQAAIGPRPARPAAVAAHARPARCVTFDVTGRPSGPGMPWDEPVTFCGAGLPAGTWMCPAGTPALGPGTRLACSREP